MTEPRPIYAAATPPPAYQFGTLTIEGLAATFTSWADVRRLSLLRELAELERSLGYGKRDSNGRRSKPTTSDLRTMWRKWHGRCPECGKELR